MVPAPVDGEQIAGGDGRAGPVKKRRGADGAAIVCRATLVRVVAHSSHAPGLPAATSVTAGGATYADELRRIVAEGLAHEADVEQMRGLARYLVAQHAPALLDEGGRYERAFRQMLCGADGAMALFDALPVGKHLAFEPGRLSSLERRFVAWRWRLRGRPERLRSLHGDFSPGRILLGRGGALEVLPGGTIGEGAGEGAPDGGLRRMEEGDAARDVATLAVSLLVVGVEQPVAWDEGLSPLWDALWSTYLGDSGDHELLDVAPPFLAWRALLAAARTPAFPARAQVQAALLSFVEKTLEVRSFDPDMARRHLR
jgi:hypothetical protein